MASWSYRVCQVQEDRVTMQGQEWLGSKPMEDDDALDSCPELRAYLDQAVQEGWEVVGVVPVAFQMVYGEEGGELAYNVILKKPL